MSNLTKQVINVHVLGWVKHRRACQTRQTLASLADLLISLKQIS